MNGVNITPLSIIDTKGGDVLHAMKISDHGYSGFGEAYFSTIEPDAIKGWKRHKQMVLNLVVPVGTVRFILFDDRDNQDNVNQFQEVTLSIEDGYSRLTIPPMIWVGFQGLGLQKSLVLNIANIEHSPEEVERKELAEIKFNWSKY
ncbi:dTDP-4-dehydrorhamnose 3,5-epimerase [Candidatus Thioglobus sp. NP1]|nr:dTDP-4-dehydrorhamnose 3,5-epimerase [Candidatus Thioglobus sp. NP1]AXE62733.1 dTDP-4-dehydrorhamnose 3,5-epimerase [Candidatus Thioglobus sp. NP1]